MNAKLTGRSFALKMGTVCSSETLESKYQTALRLTLDERSVDTQRRENLKSFPM